jgi:hypothetical protein
VGFFFLFIHLYSPFCTLVFLLLFLPFFYLVFYYPSFLRKKILCSLTVNQHVCSPSLFSKSGPLSSSQFFKTHLISYKKVSPTLKIVRDCNHVNLQPDCKHFFPSPPPLIFHLCFCLCFFCLLWVSSLAYPNLLGTKRFGCCCCS